MKIVRATLETLTQCVLLPGVELHFDDVVFYLRKEMGGALRDKVRKMNLSQRNRI
jgi:hypothetical protein